MKSPLVISLLIVGLTAACGGGTEGPEASRSSEPQQETSTEAAPPESPDPDTKEEEGTGAAASGKVKAEVIDTAFVPAELTVKVGTEVTWKQIGDQPHSVTAVNEEFDSSPKCSPLKSENCDFEGDTFSFTFEEAGTYDYYCRIHGLPTGRGMFATLTVEK